MNAPTEFVAAAIAVYGGATAVAVAGFAYGYPYMGLFAWLIAAFIEIESGAAE